MRWPIIAVMVAAFLVGHPLFLSLLSWGSSPLTVSEFNAQIGSTSGQQIRVKGTVAVGSVQWDDDTRELKFSLTDGKEKLNIYYRGMVPETFRPGNNMILEGKYTGDGILEAASLSGSQPVCTACH
ncbi:cytochrome c maturation protein CcmE [Chloroflexota bacterium]